MSRRKYRTRRLWVDIKFKVPPGISREHVLQTLINSIQQTDYTYPKSWKVAIGWRNKLFGAMKWGEFTAEMNQSATSSEGFDSAVLNYLEAKYDALHGTS